MKIIRIFLFILCFNFSFCNNSRSSLSSINNNIHSISSIILTIMSDVLTFFSTQKLELFIPKIINFAEKLTQRIYPLPVIPQLSQNIWWGHREDMHYSNTSIRSYTIKFKPERIKSLIYKLKYRENFTAPFEGAAMTYGINTNFLNYVLDYWQHEYDFEARENRFNKYPQFMTNIQGLDIHFIHIKPQDKGKKVVPLLLLHGWPVNNMEYYYVIPQLIELTRESEFVFEIVAPSIPGFGYSQGTSKIGLSPYQIGIIFKNLMKRLELEKFFIHGGDFGQAIGSDMITMYQKDILGFHTNLPFTFMPQTFVKYAIGSLYPPTVVKSKYADRLYPISRRLYYIISKFGYFHIHANHPDALDVAMTDSPSGLAAWILNIYLWATNPNNVFHDDGRLLQTYDINDLLDVLTIIWDSECITTSTRIYAELTAVFQDPITLKILRTPTTVPTAVIQFRHEIIYQPEDFLKDKFKNLLHSRTLDFGGHFAAYENPIILSDDIWKSVNKTIEFHNL